MVSLRYLPSFADTLLSFYPSRPVGSPSCLALKLCCAVLMGFLASGALAAAEKETEYPSRPIRFILGYPPGGASDATARLLSVPLVPKLGQQIVVDNRGGAGGNIAAEIAARSPADGYTWFLGNNGILATNPALYEKLPFDPLRDFATVALVGTQPSVLVVNPSLPVKSVSDLIALAKAKPGQLNYASTGTGTAGHLAGELFKGLAGVDYVHIPYKGGGPAVADLVSGQVQFMFATAASVIPHVKSGRLRALAVSTPARSATLPDLPTISETAIKGFDATTWHGVVVPARTPPAVIARINRDINAVLQTPELKEKLAALGIEARGGTPEEFSAYLKQRNSEVGESRARVGREAGVAIDVFSPGSRPRAGKTNTKDARLTINRLKAVLPRNAEHFVHHLAPVVVRPRLSRCIEHEISRDQPAVQIVEPRVLAFGAAAVGAAHHEDEIVPAGLAGDARP